MIKGALLDLAGVVYDGDHAIAGSIEAVERLRAAGIRLCFVSNTTRSTKQAVIARLAGFGLTIDERELFTPAGAAVAWLKQHDCAPHLLVHPALEAEFAGLPGDGPRAVVVGDAGDAFTYGAMNAAFRALAGGADFLALAPNRVFRDSDGELSLDAGPFVAALEYASGKQATVLGKPSAAFFGLALDAIGCTPDEAAMVGDDAENDVSGALEAGIGAALLVRTGKYRAGDETRFSHPPTALADDLSGAVEWIVEHAR
ncbi:MAG: TIGR01458 family HAD-type hydrolase [Brucellaceae bacterium]|nr:TIGR01458 family HAD-type hydrolase [Brucellaceae bacterium]